MQIGFKVFFSRQNTEQPKYNTFSHGSSRILELDIFSVIVRLILK